jgi:hypothetical protein
MEGLISVWPGPAVDRFLADFNRRNAGVVGQSEPGRESGFNATVVGTWPGMQHVYVRGVADHLLKQYVRHLLTNEFEPLAAHVCEAGLIDCWVGGVQVEPIELFGSDATGSRADLIAVARSRLWLWKLGKVVGILVPQHCRLLADLLADPPRADRTVWPDAGRPITTELERETNRVFRGPGVAGDHLPR